MAATQPGEMSGGKLIVQALLAHGIDRAFGVPGESYLPLLDALYDVRNQLPFIACRHEHGAAMMAEAHGKLTGRPGVCLVTRGPGACNAAIGVHTAFHDSTPMLLLVGQVERAFLGREAFQEVDLAAMFRPLAKHAAQVNETAALPQAIAEAVTISLSGRPGPVVLALPEDVLADMSPVTPLQPFPVDRLPPDPGLMERLHRVLGDAHRPVLLVGGSGWTDEARDDLIAFASANGLPVCCGFRRNDIVDNEHPCYVGELGIGANPALVARIAAADLLLAVGTRLGEATTQKYTLLPGAHHAHRSGPELVHVHPDAAELRRVFTPSLMIPANVAAFVAAARRLAPTGHRHRLEWAAAARAEFLADTEPQATAAAFDPGEAMRCLRGMLPDDAIVTVDAGNFSGWAQRFLRFGGRRRLLGPTNGAMGYGVPAAVAAKLAYPERMVVACIGDGGFGMTGQELATAVRQGVAPIMLVFDNGMYGTIRAHQERAYPERVIGTRLCNPDFVTLAAAYGAHGERVEQTDDFPAAFARAAGAGRAAVLHLRIDPEMVSTRTTLARLRTAGDRR